MLHPAPGRSMSHITTISSQYNILLKIGVIVPPMMPQGHGRVGMSSGYGMKMIHHAFISELCAKHLIIPLHGYIVHFKYGILLHISLTERWFMPIGPFKGTMQLSSRFPSSHDAWLIYRLLKKYLRFIYSISDHRRLVFVNDKLMKDVDIFDRTRRDPYTCIISYHSMNANTNKKDTIS